MSSNAHGQAQAESTADAIETGIVTIFSSRVMVLVRVCLLQYCLRFVLNPFLCR